MKGEATGSPSLTSLMVENDGKYPGANVSPEPLSGRVCATSPALPERAPRIWDLGPWPHPGTTLHWVQGSQGKEALYSSLLSSQSFSFFRKLFSQLFSLWKQFYPMFHLFLEVHFNRSDTMYTSDKLVSDSVCE